ncbi:MAG TPA: hypothetical protein VIS06_22730 [Mycobacteriales bacterium]
MTIAQPPDPSADAPPAMVTAVVPADSVPAVHTSVAAGLATAAAGLADLDRSPVGEHVARYDAVHATLQDALTAVDSV